MHRVFKPQASRQLCRSVSIAPGAPRVASLSPATSPPQPLAGHLTVATITTARQYHYSKMNSAAASSTPDASGVSPKQMDYLPNLKLNDGNEIPMLAYGLGTANYKSGPNKDVIDKKIIADTVMAIKCGYYHLDGADGYSNEAELGQAIKEAGVPREKLYVVTKCSKVPGPGSSIEACFEASLARLGLDYVDLYLIHSPFFADGDAAEMQAKWAQMEAIKASGRARSIGVSNFLARHLDTLLATASVPPAINQIEYHPYLQHDAALLDYHREKGIAVSAYAPLTAVRVRPGPLDDVYARLAGKYGVGEGEVALRWVLDQGLVAITTSGREERLRSFLAKVPSFKLTPAEVKEIADKGREKHYRGFWNHIYYADDHS